MTTHFARYRLGHDGTIQHWLACGPAAPPLRGLEAVLPSAGAPHGHQKRWTMNYWAYHPEVKRLKQRVYQSISPFTWKPGPAPVVDQPAIDGLLWRYAIARDDRMIDFSRFNFVPSLMLGWAYTIVVAEQEVRVPVEIYTIGPVQLWHNESLVHQFDETFSYVAPLTITTHISLNAGENRLVLHGLMPGWREARLALGMRLLGSPAVDIRLPIGAISPEKWHSADTALNHLNLKQFAVPDLPAMIELDASAPAAAAVEVTVSLPVSGSPWAQFASADVPQATARLLIQPGQSARLPLTDEIAKAMARLPGENALTSPFALTMARLSGRHTRYGRTAIASVFSPTPTTKRAAAKPSNTLPRCTTSMCLPRWPPWKPGARSRLRRPPLGLPASSQSAQGLRRLLRLESALAPQPLRWASGPSARRLRRHRVSLPQLQVLDRRAGTRRHVLLHREPSDPVSCDGLSGRAVLAQTVCLPTAASREAADGAGAAAHPVLDFAAAAGRLLGMGLRTPI
ncbi:MAG: hypothetical protein IPK52_12980 [Chloroflexi bacterium]|nr:hypothetical protein [Chloroflexota bacterium]